MDYKFKARASSCHDILSLPRAVKDRDQLSEGAKTYVKKWLKEKQFGRRKKVKNKYLDKGNWNEEDGATLLALHLKKMLDTNSEYKENDYICGTCDIIVDNEVYDIKNSWELDTFPMYEKVIPDAKYETQIQCYMDLYGFKKGHVAYVLTDCPFHILEQELRWIEDEDEKQEKAINLIYTKENWKKAKESLFPNAKNINFIEIPREKRIKIFSFEYDVEKIELIKERVETANKYIKEIL